jgi:rfaE bifunctional protein kinase chain/domain
MPHTITRERLASLLDRARDHRIAIVGDAMLDVYLRGDVDRISPEAPVPVVRVRERKHALGGAANVAQNVAALGARAELVAIVGKDVPGKMLREMLEGIDADPRALIEGARPTTTKTRVLGRAQQVVRFDEEDDGDASGPEVDALIAAITRAVDDAQALVLEDYNKGVLIPRVIEHAIARARARKIPVVVDPKFRNFFAYHGATVFKPNRRELEAALGAAVSIDHPEALPETFRRLGVEHLLLTLGERGMALLSADGTTHRVPTTAYLATMLAAGANMREASVIANFAAGVEVGKLGAATVSAAEVLEAFDDYHAHQRAKQQ